jgi:uncharacterized protein
MAGAALVVEWIFLALHLTPHAHGGGMAMESGFRWDHTAWLNLIFLAIAAPLVWRFFRSGGGDMLRHMEKPMEHGDAHEAHAEASH